MLTLLIINLIFSDIMSFIPDKIFIHFTYWYIKNLCHIFRIYYLTWLYELCFQTKLKNQSPYSIQRLLALFTDYYLGKIKLNFIFVFKGLLYLLLLADNFAHLVLYFVKLADADQLPALPYVSSKSVGAAKSISISISMLRQRCQLKSCR